MRIPNEDFFPSLACPSCILDQHLIERTLRQFHHCLLTVQPFAAYTLHLSVHHLELLRDFPRVANNLAQNIPFVTGVGSYVGAKTSQRFLDVRAPPVRCP